MQSIIQTENECFICHTTYNLDTHHCIHGTSGRKLADKWGLTIKLCKYHHTGDQGIHQAWNSGLDLQIKQLAQTKFEELYGHDRWMEIFGKNYLP